jgi:penicillin amidase
MALQQDHLSLPARALVPLLAEATTPNQRVADALARLRSWDFVLDKSSIAAAIYVTWEGRVTANLRARLVPESVRSILPSLDMKRMVDILLAPDGRFGDDPTAGRDELLLTSLTEAVAALEQKLGPDVSRWQYGQTRYKHARIMHPLSPAVLVPLRDKLDVGTMPRGGYEHTVDSTSNADNQRSGASFRIIADTADWDNSVATNAPGQSGDPDDAHYRDLFALWANGRYFPLAFTRPKVDSVAERVIRLDGVSAKPR